MACGSVEVARAEVLGRRAVGDIFGDEIDCSARYFCCREVDVERCVGEGEGECCSAGCMPECREELGVGSEDANMAGI